MTDPGGFGIGAKIFAKFVRPVLDAFKRHRKIADDELAELRADLRGALEAIETSSVQSQMSVRGSPNEEETTASHRLAVQQATLAGQRVSSLFNLNTIGGLSAEILGSRLEYREAVTDDDNPSVMDGNDRQRRCDRIEEACTCFHQAVRDEAFRRFGQGVGSKAGKLDGRKIPK